MCKNNCVEVKTSKDYCTAQETKEHIENRQKSSKHSLHT